MSKIGTQEIMDTDVETNDNDADFTTLFTDANIVNIASEKEHEFDFYSNTIILDIKNIPANTNELRQVLITPGIKVEAPVMQVSTLNEVERYPVITEVLTKLKTILP
ncbi:hypothetical protein [Trichormus azollae]|jgi:hypothetical protein|uniref:Uncharacterized protein n=1 Tax=Nostoc azollae (strain 0708) TaxID=551115 RepID=D7E5N5_NOSA0|nr:hypothetical protein [Trichormus azollae]ADI66294.1 hypothetical protein Aazo_5300 ['Nostoc azollae' 0708]